MTDLARLDMKLQAEPNDPDAIVERAKIMLQMDMPFELANMGALLARTRHPEAGMWAQKNGWKPVSRLSEMPTHHSHGALFIGQKDPFPKP